MNFAFFITGTFEKNTEKKRKSF
ncbi:hypothetical protein Gotur_034600, partial [Gossypium turneri]